MSSEHPVKNRLRRLRAKRVNRWWLLPLFWLFFFWGECVVRATTTVVGKPFFSNGLILTALFSAVVALGVFSLCNLFRKKLNRGIELLCIIFFTLFFIAQVIYYYKFHFFFNVYSMRNGGQVAEFWRIILKALWVKAIPILLLALPCVAFCICLPIFDEPPVGGWTVRFLLMSLTMVAHFSIVMMLPLFGMASPVSAYHVYHDTNDLQIASYRLGLLPAFRLDVHRAIFGFEGGQLPTEDELSQLRSERDAALKALELALAQATEPEPTEPEPTEPEPTEPEITLPVLPVRPNVDAPPNVLDIPFDELSEETDDPSILELNQFFSQQRPSSKNEKTGMFAGCNLIQITAEGFSYLAIDPELTPTLYKLQTEGFNFTNFYTAYWGVSTSDGEYVALTGTIPKSGTWSMSDTRDKAMPLTMAQQLKKQGYSARAYHDHAHTYYHRNLSHPNLGYEFYAVGSGLDVTPQWPESDVEMIDLSTADYVNQQPFHTYYMTVSGHLEYNFEENAIAAKNYELVKDLPYSEPVKCYLACQIELDRALELLLQRLDEAGVLENTVIVLSADHYPYGLTEEQQSELAGHTLDSRFELYRNACIIYKAGMTPETVEVPCSSLDLLPTLTNLMGLPFDSRLYMGHDVFSNAEPLIVFADRSWLNKYGSFYSVDETVTSFMEEPLPPEVVKYYNNLVANKFLVSQWVLETDYWRYLFGDNLLPDNVLAIDTK